MRAPFLDGSAVLTNICTDMELHSNQQTVNAAFQSSEKMIHRCHLSHVSTLLYYSVCIWQDQLDLNTLMETETHSEMIFRKCNALGFLCLITRTQLLKVNGRQAI